MVAFTLEAGLDQVFVFNRRMPKDCDVWLRDYHNQFHGGCAVTHLQLIRDFWGKY